MKKKFSSELAYVLGLLLVASGVMLMEKADFGVSMVVAPAYVIYRWLSPMWRFFSFGMAIYCFQAVLLVVMCLVLRKFRISYLFSFVTAVIYGHILDGFMILGAVLPVNYLWHGDLLCAGRTAQRRGRLCHVPHLHRAGGL